MNCPVCLNSRGVEVKMVPVADALPAPGETDKPYPGGIVLNHVHDSPQLNERRVAFRFIDKYTGHLKAVVKRNDYMECPDCTSLLALN